MKFAEPEILCCDLCKEPIELDQFVGLVRMESDHYVVGQVGCAVGDTLSFDVYAHGACLVEKGEQLGHLPIGHG